MVGEAGGDELTIVPPQPLDADLTREEKELLFKYKLLREAIAVTRSRPAVIADAERVSATDARVTAALAVAARLQEERGAEAKRPSMRRRPGVTGS